jgi:hypothetical protein
MTAFNELLIEKNIPIGKHNITITTKNSKFDKYSQKNNFLFIFYMNDETGGRVRYKNLIKINF